MVHFNINSSVQSYLAKWYWLKRHLTLEVWTVPLKTLNCIRWLLLKRMSTQKDFFELVPGDGNVVLWVGVAAGRDSRAAAAAAAGGRAWRRAEVLHEGKTILAAEVHELDVLDASVEVNTCDNETKHEKRCFDIELYSKGYSGFSFRGEQKIIIVWLSLIWDTDWLNTVTWLTKHFSMLPSPELRRRNIDRYHEMFSRVPGKFFTQTNCKMGLRYYRFKHTCMLTALTTHWLFIARTVQWIRVALRRTVQWICIVLSAT